MVLATGALVDGRYRIEQAVGRGGMATVFQAVDSETGAPVALKLLRSSDPRDAVRFRSEMLILRRLDHPGIVRLRDVSTDDDAPYLVLDLVDGSSLADQIAEGPLGLDRTLRVGEQVAAALAHAHDVGVTHRDVKPSNILLDASGDARLTDFGIARLADATHVTAAGLVVGSPRYLAPEQIAGGPVGPAADVYSLALVVIESLTGTPCFDGSRTETAFARLHHPPAVPPGLPGWLGDLLTAMTARDPWARPTAGMVANAFRERAIDVTLAAPLVAPPQRHGGPNRDGREVGRLERALVLAGLLVVSLLAWQSFGRRDPAATVIPDPTSTSVPPTVTTPSSLPPVPPATEPVVVEAPAEQPPAAEDGDDVDNSGPGKGNGRGRGHGGDDGDEGDDD